MADPTRPDYRPRSAGSVVAPDADLPAMLGRTASSPNDQVLADEIARGDIVAGRYRVLREMGRGGMGRVYAAHDDLLNREVAIKFLKPGLHEEEAVRRFFQEARAAGSLDHPNVLAVHDKMISTFAVPSTRGLWSIQYLP